MLARESERGSSGIAAGLALLALGAALGWLAHAARWLDRDPATDAEEAHVAYFGSPRRPGVTARSTVDLPALAIEIDAAALAELQHARDIALARRLILEDSETTVPARVQVGERWCDARVRLKGDVTDHVNSDKWSLRIEMESDLWRGMSAFSIQDPRTRGFLWSWLALEAARRDGLLVPRFDFVHVSLGGRALGTYFLEEHFSREMLEARGRREGPIVHFDESALWATRLDHHGQHGTASDERAMSVQSARPDAFGESRLADVEPLRRQLEHALGEMRDLQRLSLNEDPGTDRIAALQALRELQGRTVESLLDVRKVARMHALLTLFGSSHGLLWSNVRFFHDPLTARLEPVVFDIGHAGVPGSDPIELASPLFREFLKSPEYARQLFEQLGEMSAGPYLDELVTDSLPELTRFESALRSEELLPRDQDVAHVADTLREQVVFLQALMHPSEPLRLAGSIDAASDSRALVRVEAWSTTQVPVAIAGFRVGALSRFVAARDALVADGTEGSADEQAVQLPLDGRALSFRFSCSEDEFAPATPALLRKRLGASPSSSETLPHACKVEFRIATEPSTRTETLRLRSSQSAWLAEGARPEAPSLEDALARYAFLRYDPLEDRLSVAEGTWELDSDLVVPARRTLHIGAGTTLRFAPGCILLANAPVSLRGEPSREIVLEASAQERGWCGLVVLDARSPSELEHVIVRSAAAVERGGWLLTGGVTFVRSPVEMRDTRFEDARGEDALNVVDTSVVLERCVFERCASDAFDGDSVSGKINACTFRGIEGDALDFSASVCEVAECHMSLARDKGISVGESSRIQIRDCQIENSAIGVAAKDSSEVEVRGLRLVDISRYGLALYRKRPAYGPASMRAHDVVFERCGAETAVQHGASLELDGRAVEARKAPIEDALELEENHR